MTDRSEFLNFFESRRLIRDEVSADSEVLRSRLAESVQAIHQRYSSSTSIAIILGSGLGRFVDELSVDEIIPYEVIPHFRKSTAPGHAGRLVCGRLEGVPVFVLQGRFHFYEGYSTDDVTYPVQLLAALGVQELILTCAAGGLSSGMCVGDLMFLRDHLNLQHPKTPVHPKQDSILQSPYHVATTAILCRIANEIGVRSRTGTYLSVLGPNYETRAEQRFLSQFADSVGMSMVAEGMTAQALGMKVSGIATITNLCTPDTPQTTDAEHVCSAAEQTVPAFTKLLCEYFRSLASEDR
ncbi:purine-nucleoside phosphorylase [Planctomicrobium sp. SH668]|uniref:purine-nucleoside phosphorylase n=1 Tax=Planctomicrobium sp. SH668 TaxID=3448126 RepID=UPI003F5B72B2